MKALPAPSLSREEECCLKSALAFVVLRRRALQNEGLIPAATSAAIEKNSHVSSTINESPTQVSAEDDSHFRRHHERGVFGKDDRESSCQLQAVSGRKRSVAYAGVSHQKDETRRFMPFLGGLLLAKQDAAKTDCQLSNPDSALLSQDATTSTAQSMPRISTRDDRHIRSMIPMAVSTALCLYDDTVIPTANQKSSDSSRCVSAAEHSKKKDGGQLDCSRSLVYDYEAASQASPSGNVMRSHATESQGQQSNQAFSQPFEAVAHTYAILDGLAMHIASHIKSLVLYTERNARGYNVSVLALVQESIIQYIYPPQQRTEPGITKDLQRTKEEHKLILAACTVLHRIVYFDRSALVEIVVVLCDLLSGLYSGDIGQYCNGEKDGEEAMRATTRLDQPVDNLATNYGASVDCRPAGDVAAVNCLYLLESVIAMGLMTNLRGSDFFSNQNDNKDTSQSDIAADILNVIRMHLGAELTVPVSVADMAHFFYLETRKDKTQLSQRRCKENPCAVMEVELRDHSKITALNPGAKMTMRLCIFDMVQKLSLYQMG